MLYVIQAPIVKGDHCVVYHTSTCCKGRPLCFSGAAEPATAVDLLPRPVEPRVPDPHRPGAQPLLHQHLPQLGEVTPQKVRVHSRSH